MTPLLGLNESKEFIWNRSAVVRVQRNKVEFFNKRFFDVFVLGQKNCDAFNRKLNKFFRELDVHLRVFRRGMHVFIKELNSGYIYDLPQTTYMFYLDGVEYRDRY